MDCTIQVAKTKALISCAVTAQLICVFVFAYAKKLMTRFISSRGDTYKRMVDHVKSKGHVDNISRLQMDKTYDIKAFFNRPSTKQDQ